MAMTVCDGERLAPARTSQAPRRNALWLRAERAQNEAVALCAWSEALMQWQAGGSKQQLLTVSPLARLRARLATMPVIEQAKGILIFQQGCDANEAFDLLRQASQRSNVPVRDLAEQIVSGAQHRSGSKAAIAVGAGRQTEEA
jgi:hypothetical protein